MRALLIAGWACLCVAFGLALPVAADPVPQMTVTMTRGGTAVDPGLAPALGINQPIIATWTLLDAPSTAEWQQCFFPQTPGLIIDSVSPAPVSVAPLRFAPETRSVSIAFHSDGTVNEPTRVYSALCYARLAPNASASATALFRLGVLYPEQAYLPFVEDADLPLQPYPAP